MRVTGRCVVGTLVWAAMATVGVSVAKADDASADIQWFGVHAGYYSEYQRLALGLNVRQDIGSSLTVGFSGDYVLQSGQRTTFAFYVDFQYDFLKLPHEIIWAGVGGGYLIDNIHGPVATRVDPFASGYAGVGLNGKPYMPYFEVRIMDYDVPRTIVYLGFRF